MTRGPGGSRPPRAAPGGPPCEQKQEMGPQGEAPVRPYLIKILCRAHEGVRLLFF